MINKFGLCAAYENGYRLCKYAVERPYEIDFISTYEKDKSKFRLEIEEIARNNNVKTFPKNPQSLTNFPNIEIIKATFGR